MDWEYLMIIETVAEDSIRVTYQKRKTALKAAVPSR
jgi:hypothetical protein